MTYIRSQTSTLSSQSLLATKYDFNAATKYITIDHEGFREFSKIINQEDNVVIYDPQDPTLGGVIRGESILLDYDTTSMSDSDRLLIYYEGTASVVHEFHQICLLQQILDEAKETNKLLKKILK